MAQESFVSYLQEHPLYKNQAAKFPTISDSFNSMLTVSGEFQLWVGGRGGKWARW